MNQKCVLVVGCCFHFGFGHTCYYAVATERCEEGLARRQNITAIKQLAVCIMLRCSAMCMHKSLSVQSAIDNFQLFCSNCLCVRFFADAYNQPERLLLFDVPQASTLFYVYFFPIYFFFHFHSLAMRAYYYRHTCI